MQIIAWIEDERVEGLNDFSHQVSFYGFESSEDLQGNLAENVRFHRELGAAFAETAILYLPFSQGGGRFQIDFTVVFYDTQGGRLASHEMHLML